MTGYQWVVLALVSAFSLATMDALTKKILRGADEYLVGWLRLLLSVPILLAVLLFVEKPVLDGTFYLAFASAMPFEVLAFVLYIRALRVSPISLTIPFLAFTPVFLIAVSYFIVGEEVSPRGIGGIVLIAAGSYALNFHHLGKGLLEPFRAITREKGSVMMLVVAFIYSITSSLGKLAINHSSALFFGMTYFMALALVYTPFGLRGLKRTPLSRAGWKTMLLVGALSALMVVSHVLAISLTKVAYMIAVKRSSLFFSVLYGYLIFREGHMGERFLGALLMFLGFVLVVTAG